MIDLSPLDRHEKAALCVSGGKDSLAVVQLLLDHLDRVTIYHLDTGDLLPEMRASVERVRCFAPHFVTVRTNVREWQAQHGLPTDLLPHSAHSVGRAMAEHRTSLVPRYDCCWHNLMSPLFERVRSDGNTLLIRGTKRVDMVALPIVSGQTGDGVELWYPLQDWTNTEVFDYLRSEGVPLPRVYEHVTNSPECARCTAWWSEGRASYLQQYHPGLFADYRDGLRAVWTGLEGPVTSLLREFAITEARADG